MTPTEDHGLWANSRSGAQLRGQEDAAHRWGGGAQRAGLNGSVRLSENMQVKTSKVSETLVRKRSQ